MSDTNIEYANVTDNIIRVVGGGYWCRKLSAGCEKCYAEKINQNPFFGGNKLEYKGARGCNTDGERSIIKQAKNYHEYLPIFVKQLGSNPYTEINVKNYEFLVNNNDKNSNNNLNYYHYHKYEKLEFKNFKGGDMKEWNDSLNDLKLRELPKNFPRVSNKKSPVKETLYR